MGADIVERLEAIASREDQVFGAMSNGLEIREAAAEIVRLRGELAVANECLGEERAANVLRTPAPAMPNGVGAADVHLAAEMLTWGREEGLTVKQEAEVAAHAEKLFRLLRAADNRDAAGVEALPPDGAYMIVYDDQDMRPETFARSGARDAALYRFEQISGNWNAHLYAKIRSNCRDVDVPDALAAHPSACEVGELAAVAVKCGAYEYGDPSNRYYDFSSEQLQAFVAALQHRGDSQEVGRE